MRKLVYIAVLALASLSLIAATPDLGSLKVTINETFNAGQSVLPAGRYSIRPLSIAGEQSVLIVESTDGKSVLIPAMRWTPNVLRSNTKTEVVLERRDDGRIVLTTVWLGGSDTGFRVINVSSPAASPAVAE